MTVSERGDSPTEAHQSSLIAKARTGTVWTIGAYAGGQVLRFGSSLILSRLFAPQYFGLMVTLNTLMIGLTLFSDVGLATSIIRSEKGDDPHYLNTAWTVQVLRGIGLWVLCVAVSWPAGQFYNDERLFVLLPVLGLSLILNGFTSTSVITLSRHLEVRKVALLELFLQLVQLIATVLFALASRSIWALIFGRLVMDAVRLAISFFLIPGYRNRFAMDNQTARELISFGKWIFASTAVTFLANQSDKLVLPKLVSMATVGLYGVAFNLADIPRQVIMAFAGRVGFPFVSGFSRLPRIEFRAVVIKYRRMVLLAGALFLAVGVNFSDLFLVHVYDKRYQDAAWMAPILALGLWHTILYCTAAQTLTAIGKLSYNIAGYVMTTVVLLFGLPLAFHTWGLVAAIWVIAFSDLPVYFSNLYGLWKEDLFTLRQDMEMTLIFIAGTAAFYFLRLLVGIPWSHSVPLH